MLADDRYDSLLQYYAGEYGVDWKLLKCQLRAESAFDPGAISRAGALGLAQFMPSTWSDWGSGERNNPEASIRAQARYMAWLLGLVGHDVAKALAAYNWGIGKVKKAFGVTLPYDPAVVPDETRKYVARILEWRAGMPA